MSGTDLNSHFEDVESADPLTSDFQPVPPAKYHLEVVDAQLKTSKAGNAMLSMQYAVVGGQYANRRIFDIMMLAGSKQSVGISKNQLQVIKASIDGVPWSKEIILGDTQELIGGHVIGTVYVEPAANGYSAKNRVRFLEVYDGTQAEPEDEQQSARNAFDEVF